MATLLLIIAVVIACGWLGLSTYLAVAETEAAMNHADYTKCPRCHHHYFAPHGSHELHDCAPGRTLRWWRAERADRVH